MEGLRKHKGSITVKDVPADKFILRLADHLKNHEIVQMPAWGDYCKTACFKELSPLNPDWFYIRAGLLFQILNEIRLHSIFCLCFIPQQNF